MTKSKMMGYLAMAAFLGSGAGLAFKSPNDYMLDELPRYIPNDSKFRKVRKSGKLTAKQQKARNKSKLAKQARKRNKK
jgi:hypothetical protein